MDKLKYGQLDTGSRGSGSALSGTNVYTKVFNSDNVMGDKELA